MTGKVFAGKPRPVNLICLLYLCQKVTRERP